MGDASSGQVYLEACGEKTVAELAVLRGPCLAPQTRETHLELDWDWECWAADSCFSERWNL